MSSAALSQGRRNDGAMLSQVRYRLHGRRSTFARGTNFAAGAALSQGTEHFRKQ